jgi:carbon-monoxide dehydrogenase medium subunit
MIPTAFEYERATSVDDAVAKLRAAEGGGKLIAGGHSLVPLMKLRLSEPRRLIDIARIPELRGIRDTGGRIDIGAATTHHEVATSPISRSAIAGRSAAAWRTPTRRPTTRRLCSPWTPSSSWPVRMGHVW